eukprot:12048858-Alexandrium_andersonii.AAC.1
MEFQFPGVPSAANKNVNGRGAWELKDRPLNATLQSVSGMCDQSKGLTTGQTQKTQDNNVGECSMKAAYRIA